MTRYSDDEVFDYVIIGSGFGGSVSAMRLTEKGYQVLVLERGKRYRDEDFARTTWNIWKYLWLPAARCFGILQISPFRDVLVLHGAGVGGGSLGYANVLMEPTDELFAAPAWHDLADWKTVLRPHYDSARRMLGVASCSRSTHSIPPPSAPSSARRAFRWPTPTSAARARPAKAVSTVAGAWSAVVTMRRIRS